LEVSEEMAKQNTGGKEVKEFNGKLVKRFPRGNCSATIFENAIDKDGKQISVRNVVVQKSYKDAEGIWQSTNTYSVNDLPSLALVANKAYDFLKTKEKVRANG